MRWEDAYDLRVLYEQPWGVWMTESVRGEWARLLGYENFGDAGGVRGKV
jgi:hypothetical protein